MADYLLHVKPSNLHDPGVFGAFLNITDNKVDIAGFTDTSTGKKAGMRKKDRIVSIDGQRITNYAELKLMMLDKRPGDEIDIVLERLDAQNNRQKIQMKVKLGSRGMPASPHGRGR